MCVVYMVDLCIIITMDVNIDSTFKKTRCRLCAREDEKYFEIFGEQGVSWKIASIVEKHFSFELSEDDEYSHICHICWWKVETFHVFYLEILAAQKFFESLDIRLLDPCKEYNILEEINNTKFNDIADSTIEKYNLDGFDDENLQVTFDENIPNIPDANEVNDDHQDDLSIDIEPVDKIKYEFETPTAKVTLNKIRPKRKRDNPSVLADDDLIRNWCQMQCTKCPESFKSCTFKDVKVHYNKDHGMNGFLVCCEKKFFRRVRALEHIARHINPSVFSCEKCNKNFSDKPALLNHLDGHVSPDQRAYKCDSCDYSFVRRYQLSQHQKHRHFSEEKKFVCDKCSKSFITKSILQSHIRGVHSNSNILMCDVCAKTFKSKQCLHQHLLQHSGEDTTRVQCTICSAWLKHQNSLRGHMARHIDAETEHVCKECGKSAPSRGALRSHQKYVHSNTKKFACNLCVKSFKKSLTLREHIASCHTGEVLYHCPFCSKTFNSSANLCSHKKRVHQKNVESKA